MDPQPDHGEASYTGSGRLADRAHCRAVIDKAVESFGRVDIQVNNAAFQMSHESIDPITDDEWDYTFDVNIGAMFRLTKAAIQDFTGGLAPLLAGQGIRAHCVAPGRSGRR